MDPHEFRSMTTELASRSGIVLSDPMKYANRRKQDREELFGRHTINSNHPLQKGD